MTSFMLKLNDKIEKKDIFCTELFTDIITYA